MDEFIFVLLAGLLMIGILLVAWGIPPEDVDLVNGTTRIENPFSIGMFPKDVARQISLGDFEVSYAVGSKIINSKTDFEIKGREMFTFSGEIEQDVGMVTNGFITVYVRETNQKGNLIINLNEEEVFNQEVSPGKIEIPIERYVLSTYNIVEVTTSGPGWMFWVKPQYQIDKIEVGVNFYGNLEKTEDFQVYPEELIKFKTGEISFDVNDYSGEGDLRIAINNNLVFHGQPSLNFYHNFDQFETGLTQGLNTISFQTEAGSSYEIEDAVLTIIREESATKSRSFDFSVSSSTYNDDLEGEISFYISDTDYRGNLLISITDSSGDKHSIEAVQSYGIGQTKTVSFDENDAGLGTNKVNFEATGGNFVISNVEIKPK